MSMQGGAGGDLPPQGSGSWFTRGWTAHDAAKLVLSLATPLALAFVGVVISDLESNRAKADREEQTRAEIIEKQRQDVVAANNTKLAHDFERSTKVMAQTFEERQAEAEQKAAAERIRLQQDGEMSRLQTQQHFEASKQRAVDDERAYSMRLDGLKATNRLLAERHEQLRAIVQLLDRAISQERALSAGATTDIAPYQETTEKINNLRLSYYTGAPEWELNLNYYLLPFERTVDAQTELPVRNALGRLKDTLYRNANICIDDAHRALHSHAAATAHLRACLILDRLREIDGCNRAIALELTRLTAGRRTNDGGGPEAACTSKLPPVRGSDAGN